MRRVLRLAFLLILAAVPASAAPGPGAAAPAPARTAKFSDADKADLKRVSDYLNGLRVAEGHFVQIGPDGRSDAGTFYLKKPGRMRFEYERPNPNLIVCDGTTIAVENSALKTTSRYPLLNSPLRLLLSDDVDLSTDPRISAVSRENGAISVTARQNDGPAKGQITLLFADAGTGLELRQWDVVDAQNLHTLVALTDLRQVADISPQLFIIQDLSPFQKRSE